MARITSVLRCPAIALSNTKLLLEFLDREVKLAAVFKNTARRLAMATRKLCARNQRVSDEALNNTAHSCAHNRGSASFLYFHTMKKIINIKNNKKTLIVVIAILLCAPAAVVAVNIVAEGYRVGTTATTIDAHGTCNSVVSTNGQEYFVPTNSATEWSAFRNNKPTNISLSSCVIVVPPNAVGCTCVTNSSDVCATRSILNGWSNGQKPVRNSCSNNVYMTTNTLAQGNVAAVSPVGPLLYATGDRQTVDLISPVVYSESPSYPGYYSNTSLSAAFTPFTVNQDTGIPCVRSDGVVRTLRTLHGVLMVIPGGSQSGGFIEIATSYTCN